MNRGKKEQGFDKMNWHNAAEKKLQPAIPHVLISLFNELVLVQAYNLHWFRLGTEQNKKYAAFSGWDVCLDTLPCIQNVFWIDIWLIP